MHISSTTLLSLLSAATLISAFPSTTISDVNLGQLGPPDAAVATYQNFLTLRRRHLIELYSRSAEADPFAEPGVRDMANKIREKAKAEARKVKQAGQNLENKAKQAGQRFEDKAKAGAQQVGQAAKNAGQKVGEVAKKTDWGLVGTVACAAGTIAAAPVPGVDVAVTTGCAGLAAYQAAKLGMAGQQQKRDVPLLYRWNVGPVAQDAGLGKREASAYVYSWGATGPVFA